MLTGGDNDDAHQRARVRVLPHDARGVQGVRYGSFAISQVVTSYNFIHMLWLYIPVDV